MKNISKTLLVLFLTAIVYGGDLQIINWENRVALDYGSGFNQHDRFGLLDIQSPYSLTRGYRKDAPGDYFLEFYLSNKVIDSSFAETLIQKYSKHIYVLPHKQVMFKCNVPLDTIGSSKRKEYFIRYTDGKYVYVISGWWPRFIQFYRASLGKFRFRQEQFKSQLLKLLRDGDTFSKAKMDMYSKDDFYLYKGVNGNVVVCNYNVKASYYEGRSEAPDLGQPPPMFSDWYNIIEITIYLDKEFMP
jgi:hypothetical protein